NWLRGGLGLCRGGGHLQVQLLAGSPADGPLLAPKLAALFLLCELSPLHGAHPDRHPRPVLAAVYPAAWLLPLGDAPVHFLGRDPLVLYHLFAHLWLDTHDPDHRRATPGLVLRLSALCVLH